MTGHPNPRSGSDSGPPGPSLTSSTADLVGRARHGDQTAFAELVDRVSVRLLVRIRRAGRALLRADFDEEDVLQTVMSRAWETLPRSGDAPFYPWLVGIARNVIGDRGRYLGAKGRDLVGHLESASRAREVFDSATTVRSLAARREEIDRLQHALEAADADARRVLELSLLDGLSVRELAAELGCSRTAAWQRLRAAVRSARRTMGLRHSA